jgi:leucyl aminopeptidase
MTKGRYRGASLRDRALRHGAARRRFCLNESRVTDATLPGRSSRRCWRHDGLYRFDGSRARPPAKRALRKVVFHVADEAQAAAADAAIRFAAAIGQGITLARDLGNMPGNICTPTYLAEQALESAVTMASRCKSSSARRSNSWGWALSSRSRAAARSRPS